MYSVCRQLKTARLEKILSQPNTSESCSCGVLVPSAETAGLVLVLSLQTHPDQAHVARMHVLNADRAGLEQVLTTESSA